MSTPWLLMFWCHGPPDIGQAATVQGQDPEVGAWAFRLTGTKELDNPTSQLLPISRNRSWSGTGEGGKRKEVFERLCGKDCVWKIVFDKVVCERLCLTKLCVRLCLTKLCVWQSAEEEEEAEADGIQDQKQEPQTMMRGKKHKTNWQFQLSLLPAALKIRGSYRCTPLQ